jgi:Tfp pilus assembly protein PilO
MFRLIAPIILIALSVILVFYLGSAVLNGSDQPLLKAWLLNDTDQGLKDLMEEKDKLDEALGNARELRNKISELERAEQSISAADREKLDAFIPDRIDTVDFVYDINNIAARHGMVLRDVNIKASEETKAEGLSSRELSVTEAAGANTIADMTMSFQVSGSYRSLLGFLDDLSVSLRVADVTSLAFSTGENGVNQYDIELKTYWVK